MYKLYELYGTKWVEALNVATLEEIKKAIIEDSTNDDIRYFRIDNGSVPITFCEKSEHGISYCLENIESLDKNVMFLHSKYENSYQKVVAIKESIYKRENKLPSSKKKTAKKHPKKGLHKKKRYYR